MASVTTRKADFVLSSFGSLFVVSPVTRDARRWMCSHMPDQLHIEGTACVHPFMLGSFLTSVQADGLIVQPF